MDYLATTLLQELCPQYKIPLAMNTHNTGPLADAE